MWFSTRNGISVYDGARWTAFNDVLGSSAHNRSSASGRRAAERSGRSEKIRSRSPAVVRRGNWESVPLPKSKDGAYLVTAPGRRGGSRESPGRRWHLQTRAFSCSTAPAGRKPETRDARAETGSTGSRFTRTVSWPRPTGVSPSSGKTASKTGGKSPIPGSARIFAGLTVEKTAGGEKIWVSGSALGRGRPGNGIRTC